MSDKHQNTPPATKAVSPPEPAKVVVDKQVDPNGPGRFLVTGHDGETGTVDASSPTEARAKFNDGRKVWPSPKLVKVERLSA